MSSSDEIRVLSRALDQAGDVLLRVRADRGSAPTPCAEWTVADLVDHLVATPGRFAQMVRGEQPDLSSTERVVEQPATVFRAAADDLIHVWHQEPEEALPGADWQTAELAVHTWDLATALELPVADLDPEVAERGLAFLQANLSDDNRGPVFGPAVPVDDDADPYTRLAAFAGRRT